MEDFRSVERSDELQEQLEEIKKLGEDDASEDLYASKMEEWFTRAFSFMHDLPETVHCWCGHSNIMFALLEPFHSYFDSPLPPISLRDLWTRLSREMRRCTRCVAEHHKAKEYYAAEFGEEAVKPLMEVITVLDEKRVAEHMKELVQKFESDSLKSTEDSVEVICILFEVLMYALLLDDAEINEAVKPFLGHVEETHDLSFATNQRYPGVYRLLFHSDQGVRRIAQSLAHKLPLMKNQRDMDAIQPTIDKCVCCLEFNVLDPFSSSSSSPVLQSHGRAGPAASSSAGMRIPKRRRAAFSKDGLWIGLTTLFNFVESPALACDLMEKYPTFISTVLSHVSEVTSVFWHALRCLKLLLEMLGYKLWLGTSFSPGAMRNTLLSQCFHSHEERMHVSIFDLFQPFLQSLEALQDGEYENQRRRLLYFLLHQVPKSSNFKPMMTKKARQVAFSIIGHGYSMSPPLPPVDCVHMWGPPLVATLKEKGLISSLRKPATDLFECLLVADAAALATVPNQRCLKESFKKYSAVDNDDEDGEEASLQDLMEAGDQSWVSLSSVTSSVENCQQWSCVPLIWMEVLDGILPRDLPFSVTKGLLWALSRLSMFDLGDSGNSVISSNGAAPPGSASVGSLSGVVPTPESLTAAFSWVKPKGYDDGAGGEGCLNAVKIGGRDHSKELIKVFKNLGQRYLQQLKQGASAAGSVRYSQEQNWIWDGKIAEPCILVLLDGNPIIRDFGKDILHRTSNASTLETDLEFLCSTEASAAAVIRGLRHAVKLLLCLHLKDSSRALQQLFFYVWKLITYDNKKKAEGLGEGLLTSQNGEGGGFLSQPNFQALTVNESSPTPPVSAPKMQKDTRAWKNFLTRVANLLWPLLVRTVTEGQEHWGSGQLMTWTRMLQLIPCVFRYLTAVSQRQAFSRCTDKPSLWFNELISWGNISSAILERWWKEAVNGVLLVLRDGGFTFPSTPGSSDILDDMKRPGLIDGSRKIQLMDFLESISTLAQSHKFSDKDDVISSPADKLSSNLVSKEIIHLSDDDADYSWPSRHGVNYPELVLETNSHLGSVAVSKANLTPSAAGMQQQLRDYEDVNGNEVGDLVDDAPERSDVTTTRETQSSGRVLAADKQRPTENIGGQTSQFRRPTIRSKSFSSSQSNKSSTLDDYLQKFAREKGQRNQSQSGDVKSQQRNDTLRAPFPRSLSQSKSHKGDGKLSSLRSELKQSINLRSSQAGVVRKQVRERLEQNASNKQTGISEEFPAERILVSNNSEVPGKKSDSSLGTEQPFNEAADDDATLSALVQEKEQDDPLDLALESARKTRLASLSEGPAKPRRKLIALEMPHDDGTGGRGFASGRAQGSLLLNKPRQIPRLDDWYKRILSLDYLSLVHLSDENSSTTTASFGERLVQVPRTFSSAEHYLSVFRPLVLEEFKSQLCQSHNELNLSDDTTVGTLSLMSLERVDELHVGRFMAEAGSNGAARACTENDLLLLSRQPLESKTRQAQSCHLLAKVESRDRESKSRATVLLLKLFLPTTDDRLAKARRLLVDRSKWHMTRLMSITPQLRECQALSSLESIPVVSTVLSPGVAGAPGGGSNFREKNYWDTASSSDIAHAFKRVPVSLQDKLKREYNESQLRAIAASIGGPNSKSSDHQLTLIQGPPGTGKTKTIMAILSVLLVAGSSRKDATEASRFEDESATAFKPNLGPSSRQVSSKGPSSSARDAAALSRAWQDAARAKDLVKESERLAAVDSSGRKQRVLVCAQSNAAVDEIVTRICKNGLLNSDGSFFRPSVVRVGALKSVHPKSLPVYIDTLVDERLGREKENRSDEEGEDAEQKKVEGCRAKLEEVIEFIHAIEALRSRSDDGGEGQASGGQKSVMVEKVLKIIEMGDSAVTGKLNLLYNQRRVLTAEMATAAKDIKKANEESRNIRKAMKREVIRQADIVVTTLSGCGGDIYSVCMESVARGDRRRNKTSNPDEECFFDAVVIDEAAQALEPATLIPFQLLAQTSARCVMVGDPKQLPATVLSQAASRMQYECSMFERLQRAGHAVIMLGVQYRMHPEIREFPSSHFYEGRITDGEALRAERKALFHRESFFGPYVFFDVVDGKESRKWGSGSAASQSLKNDAEAAAILQLYLAFKRGYPAEARDGRLGIITPYKHQRRLLEEQFVRTLGKAAAAEVEFNTVDGFQGREVDILILSTVRAGSGNDSRDRIGFVADVRRMNVALTRARFSMWVVGNAATLEGNSSWSALLSNARSRGLIFRLQGPYAESFQKKPKQLQSLEERDLSNGDLQEKTRKHAIHKTRKLSQSHLLEDEAGGKLHGDGKEDRDRWPINSGNTNTTSSRNSQNDLEKGGKASAMTVDDGRERHGHGQRHGMREQARDQMGRTRHRRHENEMSMSRDSLWLQEPPNSAPMERSAHTERSSRQDGQEGSDARRHGRPSRQDGQDGSDAQRHGRPFSYDETLESRRRGGATDEKHRRNAGVADARSENGDRRHDNHNTRRREQPPVEKDEGRRSDSKEDKRWSSGSRTSASSCTVIDGERGKNTLENIQRRTGAADSGSFKVPQTRGHHRQDPAGAVESSSPSNTINERKESAVATVEGHPKNHVMTQNGAGATRPRGDSQRAAANSSTNSCSSITQEDRMAARKRSRADVADALPPGAFASTKKPKSAGGRGDAGIRHSYQSHAVGRYSSTGAQSERPQDTTLGRRSRDFLPTDERSRLQKSMREEPRALNGHSQQASRDGRAAETYQSGSSLGLDQILSGLSTVTQAQAKMQKLDSREKLTAAARGSKD